jgi:two-component system, LuxR family, response regulator FixJ
MSEATPLVYVVDDDEAVRDSLTLLFEAEGLAARPFASAGEFLGKLDRELPGCIVADVRMPGMSGVELLAKLQAERVTLPIILITGHGDVPMAVAALKAGAADFFEKPFDDARLVASVRGALDTTHERRQRVVEDGELRARATTLTTREREVMDLIVAGHSNKVVAARLAISPRTVEVYRARVMEKMEASSLAEIVRMAIRLEQPDR